MNQASLEAKKEAEMQTGHENCSAHGELTVEAVVVIEGSKWMASRKLILPIPTQTPLPAIGGGDDPDPKSHTLVNQGYCCEKTVAT